MRNMFRIILPLLVLFFAPAVPITASEGLQPAVMTTETSIDSFTPVIFKSGLRDMEVEEIAAIVAGAAVIGSIADMFFDSGLITILALTGGAALGSHWYEERMWPFDH